MKRIVAITLLMALAACTFGQILEQGTSSQESYMVSVLPPNTDSAGVNIIACDSFWVFIFKGVANNYIFADSGITTMSGVDTVKGPNGNTIYYFYRTAADLDYVGFAGWYSGLITIIKLNLSYLASAGCDTSLAIG